MELLQDFKKCDLGKTRILEENHLCNILKRLNFMLRDWQLSF